MFYSQRNSLVGWALAGGVRRGCGDVVGGDACGFFFLHVGCVCPGSEAAPRRRTRERGGECAINSFEVHGLVDVRRQAHSHPKYGSEFEPLPSAFLIPSTAHESLAPSPPHILSTEPVAVSVSLPPPPCGGNNALAFCLR